MEIGFIGLGRMGGNMVERLLRDHHQVVAYDPNAEASAAARSKGALTVKDLSEMTSKLKSPRAAWIMVPSGKPVDDTLAKLSAGMQAGDVIIDGGNSNFHDSVRRFEELKQKSIRFVDVGTSGGIWGLEKGYCLMIGGNPEAFNFLEPIFKSLAPADGYAHVGGPGAGHFVKMVHNGIEYGIMQAYGEGFDILQACDYSFDLHQIAKLWNHASVVRSWLLELAENALAKDPKLENIKGYVQDSGEGRWTILEAMHKDVPAPVITLSLFARFYSRRPESFTHKMLAALRSEFGGHAVKRASAE
ncbi:MAG TPA: decarboxylating 6-phosphogluconate dehydrogenase [Acidobacteriota bacterium]|jgi:6-phosphogluconate dehydrogenase